jgi:hypothetical protein
MLVVPALVCGIASRLRLRYLFALARTARLYIPSVLFAYAAVLGSFVLAFCFRLVLIVVWRAGGSVAGKQKPGGCMKMKAKALGGRRALARGRGQAWRVNGGTGENGDNAGVRVVSGRHENKMTLGWKSRLGINL